MWLPNSLQPSRQPRRSRSAPSAGALGAAALLGLAGVASAIFKHEAYATDWHHALIGPPVRDGFFFSASPPSSSSANASAEPGPDQRPSPLLFALGDRNVLAAVDQVSGETVWRQPFLHDGDTALLRQSHDQLPVLVRPEQVEQYSADGKVQWSYRTGERFVDAAPLDEAGAVLVLGSDSVSKTVNGKKIWSTPLKISIGSSKTLLRIAATQSQAFVVSLAPQGTNGNKITVDEYTLDAGAHTQSYSLGGGTDGPSCAGCVVHVGGKRPIVAWKDVGYNNLKINLLGTTNVVTNPVDTPTGESLQSVKLLSFQQGTSNIVVQYSTREHYWTQTIQFDEDASKNGIAVSSPSPKRGGAAAYSTTVVDGSPRLVRVTADRMSILDMGSTEIAGWPISSSTESLANPTQAISHIVSDHAGKLHARAVVLSTDGSWSMIQDGVASWARPEFLAHSVSATLVDPLRKPDLALQLELEGRASVLEAYMHRVKRHAGEIKQHLLPWLLTIPEQLTHFFTSTPEKELGESRKFGFDQIAVLCTDLGRAAGVAVGDGGKVMWNTDLRLVEPHADWTRPSVAPIRPGVVAVRSSETSDSDAHVVQLNVTTGKPLFEEDVTPFAGAVLERLLDQPAVNTVRYELDEGSGSIRGWMFSDKQQQRQDVWTFVPANGERIIDVAQRPPHDPTASIGRALGDRTVLYKYLNRNILLVTSVSDELEQASFTVLDGVSGRVLHTATYGNVDVGMPVVSVARENWFATSYVQKPGPGRSVFGPVLSFTELYESANPNDRGPFEAVANGSVRAVPDFPNPAPHVRAASFVLAGDGRPVSALSASVTQQGITARQLLLVADEGDSAALYALPLAALDPRRPVDRDPSADEKEEGLARYSPLLPLGPGSALSHRRQLILGGAGGAVIKTHPTGVESTGTVLVAGLDVFGTRVSPSGGFDTLPSHGGFNKLLVVATTAGLGLLLILLRPVVRQKRADVLWGM